MIVLRRRRWQAFSQELTSRSGDGVREFCILEVVLGMLGPISPSPLDPQFLDPLNRGLIISICLLRSELLFSQVGFHPMSSAERS